MTDERIKFRNPTLDEIATAIGRVVYADAIPGGWHVAFIDGKDSARTVFATQEAATDAARRFLWSDVTCKRLFDQGIDGCKEKPLPCTGLLAVDGAPTVIGIPGWARSE